MPVMSIPSPPKNAQYALQFSSKSQVAESPEIVKMFLQTPWGSVPQIICSTRHIKSTLGSGQDGVIGRYASPPNTTNLKKETTNLKPNQFMKQPI